MFGDKLILSAELLSALVNGQFEGKNIAIVQVLKSILKAINRLAPAKGHIEIVGTVDGVPSVISGVYRVGPLAGNRARRARSASPHLGGGDHTPRPGGGS